MKRFKIADRFFRGYFAVTLLLLVATAAFAKFSYQGVDWLVVNNDAGKLVLGTNGAKDIELLTDQGGTPTGWVIDDTTGDLSGSAGTEDLRGLTDVVIDGNLDLNTTGKTVVLEDGTAASTCIGTATANGTTAVTVSTTCAQTGDYVFITANAADVNTAACWATNIVDGTSFDLDCDAASTTTFNWFIVKGQ